MVRYTTYDLKLGEIVSEPRNPGPPHAEVFVAFRFNDPASKRFREEIEIRCGGSQALQGVHFTDGHVLLSESWAGKIRERVGRARFVLADVTDLSPEVLFECGFGWGLGRRILPVVQSPSQRERLPRWLTDVQVGHFDDESGWAEIVESVSHFVRKRGPGTVVQRRPEPRPGLALWLRGPDWYEAKFEHFTQACTRCSLEAAVEDPREGVKGSEESALTRVAQTSFLIAPLDLRPSDSFVHFAAGVVAAKPMAGASKQKLTRRMVKVIRDDIDPSRLVADSARRCKTTVLVTRAEDLAAEMIGIFGNYSKWLRTQGG